MIYIACALRLQDEETLVSEARWFIKEYQFVTDAYRLYAMLSRLCGEPQKSLFHSSASMKFMLRQIKAMDFTLPEDPSRPRPKKIRETVYQERASLSTRNESGETISAEDMDGALLVLYGHILYTGKSFFPALNYFFRAYALDDQNPVVLLSIALSYIHHSLKRQADNRHYLILQGLAFMHEYRNIRERDGARLSERQEMEFNFARVWHSLGILHLADEAYQRALVVGDMIREEADARRAAAAAAPGAQQGQDGAPDAFVENFSCEAAVALQSIYAQSGDLETARELTEKYLVI
jgi:general transcription factor 3C polypeptide 3 (transcription factor C subunit 4)